MKLKRVEIYTDGACTNNPGPGGWGTVLLFGDHSSEYKGFTPHSTNQKMELTAAIEGLSKLKEACEVSVYSDSAYLVNAFNQNWLENWLKRGWINAKREPVSNRDLWERLLALSRIHTIKWIKVKGHSDNKWNNRCDQLARDAIKEGLKR